MGDHDDLREFITDMAVPRGPVVPSSGHEDRYIDLRQPAGAAVIVDRGTGDVECAAGMPYRAASMSADPDLVG